MPFRETGVNFVRVHCLRGTIALAVLGSMDVTRRNRVYFFGISLIVGNILVMGAIILISALPSAVRVDHISCHQNLMIIGIALEMYAGEAEGETLPLPSVAAPLRLDLATPRVYPEYLSSLDNFVCPQEVMKKADWWVRVPTAELMRKHLPIRTDADGTQHLLDSSYWYLGYELSNDDDVEAYARSLSNTNDGITRTFTRTTWRDSDILPGSNKPSIPRAKIPVLIERPGNHDGFINVLYTDGHFESLTYPGKWPATERTIRALDTVRKLTETSAAPVFPEVTLGR